MTGVRPGFAPVFGPSGKPPSTWGSANSRLAPLEGRWQRIGRWDLSAASSSASGGCECGGRRPVCWGPWMERVPCPNVDTQAGRPWWEGTGPSRGGQGEMRPCHEGRTRCWDWCPCRERKGPRPTQSAVSPAEGNRLRRWRPQSPGRRPDPPQRGGARAISGQTFRNQTCG